VPDALVSRIFEIVGLVLSLTIAFRTVPRARFVWANYAGAATRRSEDAGPEPVPPPAAVQAMLDQLRDLGFERLGEQRTVLPRTLVVHDWLMIDASGAMVASVAPIGGWALLICASAFSDHVWLQTYHPRGESIDTQELLARTTAVSVADAIRLHRQGIEEMLPTHGQPRQVRTMSEQLVLDVEFREHHLARTLRRNTMSAVRSAVVSVALVAIFVVLLILNG
jgi:hypothetical protein